jgi:hypothetical protein
MILSEHKGILSVCALISGLGAAVSFALLVRLLFGGAASVLLEQTVMSLCVLAILSFLVAILLLTEHTRATRVAGTQSTRMSDRALIASVTRHCPGPLKVACLAGAVLATLQGLAIGDASWVSGQLPTVRELRGFTAGATVFFCLGLPVIASAAFMDGGYDN